MQLGKTGNEYIKVTKIKVKDTKIYIEYEEEGKSEKVKISYQTYEDHFIKEGDILKEDFLEILKEDKKNDIKKYISQLLIKKPYSKKDLTAKALDKFKNDGVLVHFVIRDLEKSKIIDDHEYVLTYMEYFTSSLYGQYYVTNFFREKEIASEIIESLEFNDEEELKKAKKYFELIKNKYVSGNFAKQKKKISETMLKRGFDVEIINEVLKSLHINKDIELKKLTKEYLKIKEKVLKNSEKEDKSYQKEKVISYLVSKGYKFEEIEELIAKDTKGELNDD